jgi:sugar/nucleoside kinase (ribokinase family)
MYEICCIGHITLDRIVTATTEKHMAGGTSFYFSNALRKLDLNYGLVTALATTELSFVDDLRASGISVNVFPSAKTVYFENSYSANLDHRTQRVLQEADPFTVAQLADIEAEIFHLGPLLANDISVELIRSLSYRSKVSLDVQGYLREVREQRVCAVGWSEKKDALQYVYFVKADETELEVLTGVKGITAGAEILADWGVKEIVVTRASLGSVIYAAGISYDIPAYVPAVETDATGCGDTYMAGYLYKRVKEAGIQESGEFGAAMASLKIESSGPFNGTQDDIELLINNVKA